MLFDFLISKRSVKEYRPHLIEAIINVKQGDESYLLDAYTALFTRDKELIETSVDAIGRLLSGYTMSKMIRLSENFRELTSLEWSIDWKKIQISSLRGQLNSLPDYVWILILSSFHPNGYVREQSLSEMVHYPHTLPYLILRMNDWVLPVRSSAFAIIKKRLADSQLKELLQSLPALEKVRSSGRRDRGELELIEQAVLKQLEPMLIGLSYDTIGRYELGVKKSIYRILLRNQIPSLQEADELLCKEKDNYCQSIIMNGILEAYTPEAGHIYRYFSHRNSAIRRKALAYKYGILKDAWTGLEFLLLDQNFGVRQWAVYILQHHSNVPILEFYLNHLQDPDPVIPILGLGENGDKDIHIYVRKFLDHPSSPQLVRAAVRSMSRLLGADGGDLYWNYLFHENPTVSRAGYLAIRSNSIRYGTEYIYTAYKKCDTLPLRHYLLQLLLLESSWSRLPYLIEVYQPEGDERVQNQILTAINQRSIYAKITERQALIIREALQIHQTKLPQQLIDNIIFDLRFVTETGTPFR